MAEDVFKQAGSVVPTCHFHSPEIVKPGVTLISSSNMLAVVELEDCRV